MDARAIKLVFGVVVVALGAEMLSREYSKKRVPSSRLVLAIIGVVAGVLCGLFGVGALLAAYVNRVTDEDSSFKANISAVFIVDNTFRIILYSALGLLTFDTVLSVLKTDSVCTFWGVFWESNAAIIWMEKMLRRLHRYCWYCPVFR